MNTELSRISAPARSDKKAVSLPRVVQGLVLIIFILSTLGVLVQVANRLMPGGYPLDVTLTRLTNIDIENSIPNWYSTSLMLASAGLLAFIAYAMRSSGNRYTRYWQGLALIFVYLSIDENVSIHNMMDGRVRSALDLPGFLHYVWVVPVAILLLIFLAVYRPFLMSLPSNLRRWLIIAGGIYVAGAMGQEMVGGLYASVHGTETMTYYLIVTVEEVMEGLGLVIFIYALLSFIREYITLDIHLSDQFSSPPQTE